MAFSVAPDTCVLYPAHRRDTLLRLAESSLYRPLWSSEILAELDLAPMRVIEALHRQAAANRRDPTTLPALLIALERAGVPEFVDEVRRRLG